MAKKMKKKGYMKGGIAKKGYSMGGALGSAPPIMPGSGMQAMESDEDRKKRMMRKPMMNKGGAVGGKKGFADGGLTGRQTELDKNKDGKISGEDFKMMKKATGGMAKKGYAAGGMAKKGYANGGVAKKKKAKKSTKSKSKVRGAGIAKKGVRKCKMR